MGARVKGEPETHQVARRWQDTPLAGRALTLPPVPWRSGQLHPGPLHPKGQEPWGEGQQTGQGGAGGYGVLGPESMASKVPSAADDEGRRPACSSVVHSGPADREHSRRLAGARLALNTSRAAAMEEGGRTRPVTGAGCQPATRSFSHEKERNPGTCVGTALEHQAGRGKPVTHAERPPSPQQPTQSAPADCGSGAGGLWC